MEDIAALYQWRFYPPHPHVRLKREVVYWQSQKRGNKPIQPLCGICEVLEALGMKPR